MSNVARQILSEMNRPLAENLRSQFITFLDETNQKSLIEIAQNIDWSKAAEAFLIEFGKLWNNMAVPRTMKKLDGLKNDFADLVLINIKQKLFYDTFVYLKSLVLDRGLKGKEFSSELNKFFYSAMYDLFRVFDYQYTLSSLHKNSDAKFMLRKLEDLMQRNEHEEKVSVANQSAIEFKVFEMIDKEMDRRERIGQRWSVRAACEYYAKNELGYGKDDKNQSDLDQFFVRYQTHRQKNKPNK
jgi:hypothetical protein